MAVDTPAKIAILGAGPIGLEAALYARFLGYEVDLYERGRVAENLHRWGHVRLFSPFGMNRSTLGLAALRAQDENYRPPAEEALLTGREFVNHYLLPLSQTDLLADGLHEQTEVIAVGRPGPLKHELVGSDDRIEYDFRLLLRRGDGSEQFALADVVIDATGVYGNANWLGFGGIPASGEVALRSRIEYGLPDLLGSARSTYGGRHVLLIGGGYSAATNVVALAALAEQEPGTRVTWITRRAADAPPIRQIANDRLPERAALAAQANDLASGTSPRVAYWPEASVDAVDWQEEPQQFHVRLLGKHAGELAVDRIIANVGFRPDHGITSELQVHLCYATEGPMKLAAALAGAASLDCLDQTACGPQSLLTPEPDFYILGAKSYGRDSRFLISVGLEQIRELFTIIGDRPDLNLYQSIGKLP